MVAVLKIGDVLGSMVITVVPVLKIDDVLGSKLGAYVGGIFEVGEATYIIKFYSKLLIIFLKHTMFQNWLQAVCMYVCT